MKPRTAIPVVLPGEQFVLFSTHTGELGWRSHRSGAVRAEVSERCWSSGPRVRSGHSTGHLLFARDGVVMAAALDARTATLQGPADPGAGVRQPAAPRFRRPGIRAVVDRHAAVHSGWLHRHTRGVGGPRRSRQGSTCCPPAATRIPGSRRTAARCWWRSPAVASTLLDLARGTRARSAAGRRGRDHVDLERGRQPRGATSDSRCRTGWRPTAAARPAPCLARPSTTSPRRQGPIPTR